MPHHKRSFHINFYENWNAVNVFVLYAFQLNSEMGVKRTSLATMIKVLFLTSSKFKSHYSQNTCV